MLLFRKSQKEIVWTVFIIRDSVKETWNKSVTTKKNVGDCALFVSRIAKTLGVYQQL